MQIALVVHRTKGLEICVFVVGGIPFEYHVVVSQCTSTFTRFSGDNVVCNPDKPLEDFGRSPIFSKCRPRDHMLQHAQNF